LDDNLSELIVRGVEAEHEINREHYDKQPGCWNNWPGVDEILREGQLNGDEEHEEQPDNG
jgi:hypothetical protein